jgi:hypothetical protein
VQRHKVVQGLILDKLKGTPEGLSQLALMCKCHGYRYAHRKLLFFSVPERAFLQARRFEEAEQLLKMMLGEADAYYKAHAEKFRAKEVERRRQQAKLEVYDLVEPPKEVVIRPTERRLVSGNPAYSKDDWALAGIGVPDSVLKNDWGLGGIGTLDYVKGLLSSSRAELVTGAALNRIGTQDYIEGLLRPIKAESAMVAALGGVPAALRTQMQMIAEGLSPEDLQPPQYETIPEQREPSSYALLENELAQKLRRYPKVVWQKLKSERRFAEDDEILRQVQVARQATRRALLALVDNGEVVSRGERANAIYSLADDSGA